jgi:hypothetical protein
LSRIISRVSSRSSSRAEGSARPGVNEFKFFDGSEGNLLHLTRLHRSNPSSLLYLRLRRVTHSHPLSTSLYGE